MPHYATHALAHPPADQREAHRETEHQAAHRPRRDARAHHAGEPCNPMTTPTSFVVCVRRAVTVTVTVTPRPSLVPRSRLRLYNHNNITSSHSRKNPQSFSSNIEFSSKRSQISISLVVRYLKLTDSTRGLIEGIARLMKLKSGTFVTKNRYYSKKIAGFCGNGRSYDFFYYNDDTMTMSCYQLASASAQHVVCQHSGPGYPIQ